MLIPHSFIGVVLKTFFIFPLKAINAVRIKVTRNRFSNKRHGDWLDGWGFAFSLNFSTETEIEFGINFNELNRSVRNGTTN